jgi:hypothetical protein
MFSDENINVINFGALGTVAIDLEATLTVIVLATAIILNVAKTIEHLRRDKVSKG